MHEENANAINDRNDYPKVPRLAPDDDLSYRSTQAQIAELKRVAAHSKAAALVPRSSLSGGAGQHARQQ